MGAHFPCFKAYDIRGTVPDQVNPDVAYRAARALADWSKADEVIVGRDARLSSPALAESVINGLLDGGVTVWDIGLVSTPILNFAVARHRRYGMMVTASHNPKEYNGIKLIDPNVEQIYYGRGLEVLEALVAGNRFAERRRKGRLLLKPVLQDYQDYLYERFRGAGLTALSAVVDCSNGVGGVPLGVLERLGLRATLLYQAPDGNFPNHGCDTLRPENLLALQRTVIEQQADLGIMFDGDADRVVFVYERGTIAPIDQVFVLLARQALDGATGRVFYDLRFSRSVKEEIERLGGTPVMMRVGNPFYKEALHRHADGLLAAELSGHIMYREHFGIDDALFAALKLMSYLVRARQPFSRLLEPLRHYASSGELRLTTKDPAALVERVKAHFGDGELAMIDGVTVSYPDWWMNLRASNTEPIAKLVIEANSPALLERRKAEIVDLLRQGGGDLE
jgi:phosphomannomutase